MDSIIVTINYSDTTINTMINGHQSFDNNVSTLSRYILDKKRKQFDNEYMYVTSKTTQEKIPLKDIYKVKLTMMSLNYRSFWKIGYIVDNNSKRSVRILEKWKDQNFIDFKDLVRSANKKVIIKNWSYIFDFDQ